MAIINCPECEKEISDQAASCPNCGMQINEPHEKKEMMFCAKCGKEIDKDAMMCPHCGVATQNYHAQQRTEQTQQQAPVINISNVNTSSNVNTNTNTIGAGGQFGKPKNKWLSLGLCALLGVVGAHKFYEGRLGMGVLYIFTAGLFFIGVVIDFIKLLFKPNPYYVNR